MHVGFLAFHEVEELDLVGPWEIFGLWAKKADGPQWRQIVSQLGGEVTCSKGMRIAGTLSFSECPQLDILVVPGGQGTRAEVDNREVLQFLSDQAPRCKMVLSVCTGAFLLAAAGLLEGKSATTHWASIERLRALPGICVRSSRYVRDGKIWSAAGVSAGIDLALAVVAEIAGEETAGQVQLAAEYYPDHRVYGPDLSSKPQYQD